MSHRIVNPTRHFMEVNSLWGHLPLLVRANSKESIEYILQALWRTRNTGLDTTDRELVRQMLQLPNDSDLDPVCTFTYTLSPYIYDICIYINTDMYHVSYALLVSMRLNCSNICWSKGDTIEYTALKGKLDFITKQLQ